MQVTVRNYSVTAFALAAFVLTGCGSSDGDSNSTDEVIDKALLENYVDNVVIKTYQLLADRSDALVTAVTTLKATPTAANLKAARDAWVATREPWEQSEGFIFGPVALNGYDPAMDSWPLNKTDLNAVLSSSNTLSKAYIATLADNQKGFHTIEFLIYGEDSEKEAGDFSAREFEYLIGASGNLNDVAADLVNSWKNGGGGDAAFGEIFATAGDADNKTYPSLTSAGEEIIGGLLGICEEVDTGKIEGPFAAQDPNLVESQFSFNSLQDFSDNLRSVQNVWLGHMQGETAPAGVSLSEHIAAKDAELDTRVKAEIEEAIEAILAIPAPFPKSLLVAENATTIKAAQAKIKTVFTTLQDDVLPIVKGN